MTWSPRGETTTDETEIRSTITPRGFSYFSFFHRDSSSSGSSQDGTASVKRTPMVEKRLKKLNPQESFCRKPSIGSESVHSVVKCYHLEHFTLSTHLTRHSIEAACMLEVVMPLGHNSQSAIGQSVPHVHVRSPAHVEHLGTPR